MLPDFPREKRELSKLLMKIFTNSAFGEMGPFEGMPSMTQHEGRQSSYSTVDGVIKQQDYQATAVEYQVLYSDIPNMTLQDVVALIQQKGKEMGGQMSQYFFKVFTQTVDEVGNNFDAKGRPLSIELLHETLEKLEIPFDEDGNPSLPKLIVSPSMGPRIEEMQKNEKEKPEYKEKYAEIMARKKKEWDEKQNSRKLVD